MNRHQDSIIFLPALAKIVRLEVKGFFRKTISVGEVVDRVNSVEGINTRCVNVYLDCRCLRSIVRIVEVESSGTLRSGSVPRGFVCYNVVSTNGE